MTIRKFTSSPRGVLDVIGSAKRNVPATNNDVSSETEKDECIEYETENCRYKHLWSMHRTDVRVIRPETRVQAAHDHVVQPVVTDKQIKSDI